jgi:hypothetical protein
MTDLKKIAQWLVDLTVKDVNDLKESLEEYYPCDSCNCIIQDYELKSKYFVPRKFVLKKHFYAYMSKRRLLIKHRKII